MSLFISHYSALAYLRSIDSVPREARSRAIPQPGQVPTSEHIYALKQDPSCSFDYPVHLAVADARSRGGSSQSVCHVWRAPRYTTSFLRMVDGVYVSTPEACFLQLAPLVSVAELVAIGLELCGTYALAFDDSLGYRTRTQGALTTAAALRRSVERAAGLRGSKNAREALRFIADGSASPMETATVELLCLPTAYGGYGLSFPQLNGVVSMPEEVRVATGRKRCICDLYWPDAKVAVEYDSDMWHTGSERMTRDSKRRTALVRSGVSVITVARGQVYDARAFHEVARALAKLMGKRLRIQRRDWGMQRFEVRKQVLMGKPGVAR